MKKILALLLLLASVAGAQTPVSVRYQATDPNLTVNCSPGAMVWNTVSFNPFLCNAPVSGGAPRYKSMLTAASAGFPLTKTVGTQTVTINGDTDGTDVTSAHFLADSNGNKFVGSSGSIGGAGILWQGFVGTGTNFFQHDVTFIGTKVESVRTLTATSGPTRSFTETITNNPSAGSYSLALTGSTSRFSELDVDPGELNFIGQSTDGTNGPGSRNTNFNVITRDGPDTANFFRVTMADGVVGHDMEIGLGTWNPFDVAEQNVGFGRFQASDAGQVHVIRSGVTIKGAYDSTTGSKPTCDVNARNSRWFTQGASGTADRYEVCLKDSADTYSWKELAPEIAPVFGGVVIKGPQVSVTQAEVQALGTTEKDLVTAVSGFSLIPRMSLVAKAAGAYTVVGVNTFLVGFGTVAQNIPACPVASAQFGVLVAAGTQTDLGCTLIHNGLSAGLPFGVLPNVTQYSNKKLALRTTGASPAGAGGALTVRVWYEQVPDALWVP